ncbi:hypothetical protein [Arthrobacter sp. H5]|uniref:hypothetical protein n=1 Tax=Arthrobacter sp. H5 TaxID=1267973 RepID=UPI0004B9881D|nr:hypothetical protein [Arthrobacter sp. H5]
MAANQSSELVMQEHRAREAWGQRDYETARRVAGLAADLAQQLDEQSIWWNMTFLRAECMREEGLVRESVETARLIAQHPLTIHSDALTARVFTLLAVGLQGLGQLDVAVEEAATAVESAAGVAHAPELQIEAQHALIATLAESDRLDDAWSACLALSKLISPAIHTQTAGKAYWVIGNVAFMRQQLGDGSKFHQMAAEHLSPNNDLDLWARFNRASAALRLTAGVVDAETLECIERAELASSIVGGSERDRLQLSLTRAHWLLLTGQLNAAIERLRPICTEASLLSKQTAGEANLLLGQALAAQGEELEALAHLEISEESFTVAGAHDRALHVRNIVAAGRS